MTGLSRCGRRYPDQAHAVTAAESRTFKSGRPWIAASSAQTGCGRWDEEHWHVIEHQAASRPDPFPPAVAKLLDARDEHCQRCGKEGRLERHHRRAKASGGSGARAHTQCACNGVKLCRGCHRWVHVHPADAREAGWIVRQSVSQPGSIPMTPWHTASWNRWYPLCEGGWSGEHGGMRL